MQLLNAENKQLAYLAPLAKYLANHLNPVNLLVRPQLIQAPAEDINDQPPDVSQAETSTTGPQDATKPHTMRVDIHGRPDQWYTNFVLWV